MKSKFFSTFFVAIVVSFLFVGCGLQVPDDTKQLTLTGPASLSVGSQPAEGTFTALALDNPEIFTDRGKDYGTSPVLPYNWTVSYYNGNQPIKLVEDLAGPEYKVKFHKPGKYGIEVSLRSAFESGAVVNAEVWTGKQMEVNVSQGTGYSASNFTPGLMVSTSTGAAVMLTTNILVVRDWGVTSGYNPPADSNPDNNDPGRAGNAVLSFDEVKGQKNGQIIATLSVEGLLDNLSTSGVYFDKTLLTFKSVSAISGSGWSVANLGAEIGFVAKNSNPQSGKVASFQVVFQAKNIAGISGITWDPASYVGTYKGEKIALTGVDGIVRVE